MTEKHNFCKDLESIEGIVKIAKTSNKFLEMISSLTEMEKNVSKECASEFQAFLATKEFEKKRLKMRNFFLIIM